ncbi:hypothetical protein [Mesonia sp. K7]|uniref:hypothetical protein n=1 Tax=Mesonia sp. K7 TaxID=2218606 RepID=UPI000DAA3BB0|nr:hypothetical protein [Mesonia sp. K7]PZD77918.1 hypothetical protein DNG35_07445 [Mesonia sp. K7]
MKKKSNIHQQHSGFKVPENYFANFKVAIDGVMQEKIRENKKQQKAGFTVPDNYFENFSVETPKKQPKVVQLFTNKHFRKVAAIAAIFIGIFVAVNTIHFTSIENKSISGLAIENYLNKDLLQNDSNEWDLDYPIDETYISDELNQVNEEAILEYLSQNAELTTLINP